MLHGTSRGPLRLSLSRQELALIGITAIWGSTFLVVREAMTVSGPFFFVGLRFLSAGVISVLVFHRALRGLSWKEVGAGAAIGLSICLGYGGQTVGLQTISSSMSAFITALYVPLVPLIQWAVFRRAPKAMTWIGVGLAFVGLVLIAGPSALSFSLGPGEIVTMIATIPIAAEVILIGLFAGRYDVVRVTVVQLFAAGLFSLSLMPATGETVPEFSWLWLVPAVGLGAASCLIQATMNWAQKSVSPTNATIIYAGEPVWGGVVGRIAGERLPALALLGAAFIVVGVIVSDLKPKRRDGTIEEDDFRGEPASASSATPAAEPATAAPAEAGRRPSVLGDGTSESDAAPARP